jgi:tripartite ATP-independent transporter DctM subunit
MSLLPALQRAAGIGRGIESLIAAVAILAMAILPVSEMLLRPFDVSIRGQIEFVKYLTLWVAFLGAMIATREKRHLTLSTGLNVLPERLSRYGGLLAAAASTAVTAGLAWAGLTQVLATYEFSMSGQGNWLPSWVHESVIPLAFAVITVRLVLQAESPALRAAALAGIAAGALLGQLLPVVPQLAIPLVVVLVLAAVMGAPIFVVIGGAAMVLFLGQDFPVPVAAVPAETLRIVVSPSIPAIPLFTLAGYLLAEGKAGERLVRLFRTLFGWLPGGLPIVATLVCAFFTTFTGASGATILALGGLLLPVLVANQYSERFSLGLLTATGSIGLLFPPSLAVILYAVIAQIPIPDLFVAGIVPGAIMVGAVCLYGVWRGHVERTPRIAFDRREALAAAWEAKWEVALPVIVLVGLFGGYGTLVELSAVTVVYVLITGLFIHRDLDIARNLPEGVMKCVTLIGGVFTILGVAMGLTNYLVDAQVPMHAADWVEAHVESKLVFLLALNVFLLVVGCLMDIFSAIAVVVPLILPIAAVFGIHPLHLGIIFLANLELGYLTPPVGMNLFLAAYRFEKPVVEVWRAGLPFLLLLALVVLLVTYVPWIVIGAV